MEYDNYFKKHYKYNFSKHDIDNYVQWFHAQWKVIDKKIKIDNRQKILEIGSGMGGFYKFLNSSDYIGIELDREAVDFANKYYNTDIFRQSSLEELKVDRLFELIFAFEVLEHLEKPSESIKKIFDILGPAGIFVGTTPFPFRKNVHADSTHVFVLHPSNWERLFLSAGFRKVTLRPMSFIPFIWKINKHLNIPLPFYLPFKGFVSTCLIIAHK